MQAGILVKVSSFRPGGGFRLQLIAWADTGLHFIFGQAVSFMSPSRVHAASTSPHIPRRFFLIYIWKCASLLVTLAFETSTKVPP